MGCRNPYRFYIDNRTDVLYFGDVGPDAWDDGVKGPRGFDEVNMAKTAGFYGWPYFVADNKAYKDYNYATGVVGSDFNPLQAMNDSPNNTGIKRLPVPQKPAIWYHKGLSEDFPYMGSGGMNIMVGPKYYADDYPPSPTKFPTYFNDRLFIYDWVRNWILTIQIDDTETDVVQIEPFLPTHSFNKIMDMKFGQDGSLYLLEYGRKGFQANEDAALRRIRYSAGRKRPGDSPNTQNQATDWADIYHVIDLLKK
ncbi:MAG: PQQ-dependent sugar dehydrogenase [Saprospiraceae bacterium]|nr:PQQ-dependent sugar dehydrogenase [Saprospiraceae bacterium]